MASPSKRKGAPQDAGLAQQRVLNDEEAEEEGKQWIGDDTKFSWDYCFVFKTPKDEEEKNKNIKEGERKWDFARETQVILDKLKRAGLHHACYLSVQGDEVYCLIGITEKRLREEADNMNYDLPLVKEEIIKQGTQIELPLCKFLNKEEEEDKLLKDKVWYQYYGRYDNFNPKFPDRQKLYKKQIEYDRDRAQDTFFRSVDRLRIIFAIMETHEIQGGAQLSVFKLQRDPMSPLIEAFPLHDNDTRDALEKKWFTWWPVFSQPLHEIRDYFGEKVAYYFSFLQFYCQWLVIPACLGLLVFIQQCLESERVDGVLIFTVDVWGMPIMGACVALWASLFLEFWKRRESTLRCEWGMTNFTSKEPLRADFQGDYVRNPRTGAKERYFPWPKKLWRIIKSQTLIWGLIACVLSLVVGIFFLRNFLKELDSKNGVIYASLINFVQIQVMNAIYGTVAVKLNDYENHQTASAYENALIFKSFLFKFINCYNTFFYIAFFKQFDTAVDGCNPVTNLHCLPELQVQLAVVFGSSIIVSNSIELITPVLKNVQKAYANKATDASGNIIEKSPPEEQAEFTPYETFSDYDELTVQFGYVSLFVVAFPMAPAMALLNNYFEIRIDAHKILRLSQRPTPQGCDRVGTWFDIFTILSYIAVLVNTLICVFYTEVINELARGSFVAKTVFFVVAEHLIILLKVGISNFVEDVPRVIQDQIIRQQFLVEVLIDGDAFEEDDDTLDLAENKDEAIEQNGVRRFNYESKSVKLSFQDLSSPTVGKDFVDAAFGMKDKENEQIAEPSKVAVNSPKLEATESAALLPEEHESSASPEPEA
eukprot:g27824.t1